MRLLAILIFMILGTQAHANLAVCEQNLGESKFIGYMLDGHDRQRILRAGAEFYRVQTGREVRFDSFRQVRFPGDGLFHVVLRFRDEVRPYEVVVGYNREKQNAVWVTGPNRERNGLETFDVLR